MLAHLLLATATLIASGWPSLPLEARIAAVLPRADEDRYLEVPWRTNLLAARREAASSGRPIFLWSTVGNPLGCT